MSPGARCYTAQTALRARLMKTFTPARYEIIRDKNKGERCATKRLLRWKFHAKRCKRTTLDTAAGHETLRPDTAQCGFMWCTHSLKLVRRSFVEHTDFIRSFIPVTYETTVTVVVFHRGIDLSKSEAKTRVIGIFRYGSASAFLQHRSRRMRALSDGGKINVMRFAKRGSDGSGERRRTSRSLFISRRRTGYVGIATIMRLVFKMDVGLQLRSWLIRNLFAKFLISLKAF